MAACGGGRLRLPVMTLSLQCTYAISFGPAGGGDASYLLRSRTNPTAARRSVRPAGGGAIRGTGRAAPRRPDGSAPGGLAARPAGARAVAVRPDTVRSAAGGSGPRRRWSPPSCSLRGAAAAGAPPATGTGRRGAMVPRAVRSRS